MSSRPWSEAVKNTVAGVIATAVVGAGLILIIGTGDSPSQGESLAASLAGQAPGLGGGACTLQRGRDWWWCGVETDPGSGFGQMYRLDADADQCWVARPATVDVIKRAPNRGRPTLVRLAYEGRTRLSGCVGSGKSEEGMFHLGRTGQLPLAGE